MPHTKPKDTRPLFKAHPRRLTKASTLKKAILLLSLILTADLLHAQNKDWSTHQFDSLVSVDMPGEINKLDTTLPEFSVLQITSEVDSALFLVNRSPLKQEYPEDEFPGYPNDEENLKERYKELSEKFEGAGFSLEGDYCERQGVLGYHIKGLDSLSRQISEYEYYIQGKYYYIFLYRDYKGIDENVKERFFNSIKFYSAEKEPASDEEDYKNSMGYRIGYKIGEYLIPTIILIVFLFFVIRKMRRP